MKQALLNQEKLLYKTIEEYKKSWFKESFFESTLRPQISQFNRLCANEKDWFVDNKNAPNNAKSTEIDTNQLVVNSYKAPLYSHSWGNCAIEHIVSIFGTFLLPVAGEIILLGALAGDAYFMGWEKVVVPPSRRHISIHPAFIPENAVYLNYLSNCAKMYLGCVRNNRSFSSLARVKCFSEF